MDSITPIILSVCRKNRLSREESCDVFGQVSYKLLKNLKKIKSAARLFNYVATIAARESINIYRRAKLDEKAVEQIYTTIYDFRPPEPDEIYAWSKRLEIINRAMMRLPEREYRLLKAMYFEEGANSYQEIAEKLEMPVSSIGPTRARGLMKLYKMLKNSEDFI